MYNESQLSEKDRNKELEMLKNSYQMYEASKDDMIKTRKSKIDKNGDRIYNDESIDETLKLMETMQEDIKTKYLSLGGDPSELTKKVRGKKKGANKDRLKDILARENERDQMAQYIEQLKDNGLYGETNEKNTQPKPEEIEEKKNEYTEVKENLEKSINTTINNKAQYDMIPLPSKGEPYSIKCDKLPVGYLTAYDENLIISPNIYKDGTFLSHLLKNKVLTDKIDVDDLLPGDRDAIILWLRASGYGNEYPVSVKDARTGKKFDTVIDLSKLKFKEFTLKGDENGYFDFTTPLTGDFIKFKFLTQKEVNDLTKITENELLVTKKSRVNTLVVELEDMLEDEGIELDDDDTMKLNNSIKRIKEVMEKISDDKTEYFTHAITNRLIFAIKSVNNITDRKYIADYVMNMNVKDASALRKYITENEPGIDFNIEVERPESLGGGSTNTFLSLDQFIFLNVVG